MIKRTTVIFIIIKLLITLTVRGYSGLYLNTFSESVSSTKNPKENNYDISYTIEPFYDINIFRFIVVLEFKGDKTGETKIVLPNEYGGQYNLEGIKYLKPISENTNILDTDKPDQKIVRYPPESNVKIYYQVEEIRDDDIELGNHYMVVLNRRYFHFLGETFFIIPEWDRNNEYKFRISWNHMPSTWNLANSFGINEKVQSIKSSISKFRYSIFTGGDFRLMKKSIGNNSVYLSIRGNWKFTDDRFLELTKEILRVERDFWRDHNFPFFLITIMPIDGGGDQGGTGRTNAYSLFLSDDREIDYRLKRIIAHESFHTWLGEKMKFAEPEQLVYWFKEGFCDYYTRLLLLRAKLITLDEYVIEYNKILSAYYSSSVRYEKNERVINEFWTNQKIMMLPYMRGDIIAHNLNTIISKNNGGTKSLDDLMRDIYKRTQSESLVISNGSLSALIRFYAGDQALSDIMKTLNSGVTLKTHPEALGPCFKMEIDSFRKFWLIGELFEIPYYIPTSENILRDKKCLEWFGVN